VDGLAHETHLSARAVEAVLNAYPQYVQRSRIPRADGAPLFKFRSSHYTPTSRAEPDSRPGQVRPVSQRTPDAPKEADVRSDRGRVFLCHASEDKAEVRALYERLITSGFQPWLDEEDLLPGQNWDREIERAVREAQIVLVCLSTRSERRGYIQKEISRALDVAEQQREEAIFLIPVRLEECAVPDRLAAWQWVDLHSDRGYAKLEAALRFALSEVSQGKQE
jgi:hypothetical protein